LLASRRQAIKLIMLLRGQAVAIAVPFEAQERQL